MNERIEPPVISAGGPCEAISADVFVSHWFDVDQARIDAFAKVTEDHQFIHVDPALAAATPFGGTIAHGFLTLSLLSPMAYSVLPKLKGLTSWA